MLFASVRAYALESHEVVRNFTHTVAAGLTLDFNRTLGTGLDFFARYDLTWSHWARAGAGLACDPGAGGLSGFYWEGYISPIPDFGIGRFSFGHLELGLKILDMIYPDYGKSVGNVIPVLQWKKEFCFLTFGFNFRYFNSYPAGYGPELFSPDAIRDTQFYWALGWVFTILPSRYYLTVDAANCDEFFAGDSGTIRIFVRNNLNLGRGFSLRLDLGFQPAGNVALAGNYQHFIVTFGGRCKL